MSTAKPMTNERRQAAYLAQTGRRELTPAQRRRVAGKVNEARRIEKGFPARPGRLRRRYDRKDQRRVAAEGRRFVAMIRNWRGR